MDCPFKTKQMLMTPITNMGKWCRFIIKQNGHLKKTAGGLKDLFSEYFDETSYSFWKRISLNKHIIIIDYVGLILTGSFCHIVLTFNYFLQLSQLCQSRPWGAFKVFISLQNNCVSWFHLLAPNSYFRNPTTLPKLNTETSFNAILPSVVQYCKWLKVFKKQ